MKKLTSIFAITLFLVITGFTCSEQSAITQPQTTEPELIDPTIEYNEIVTYVEDLKGDEISPEEAAGLIFMREEEKLARDVYLTFFDQYGTRPFNFISRSESTHMRAILFLLNRYEIEDPVGENGIGEFENEELTVLYTQLLEAGNVSELEALKVGAAIEEIDILDLIEKIEQTDNEDIAFVYSRLKRASGFHLRAFVWNLHIRGFEYEPQYLDIELFNEILGR